MMRACFAFLLVLLLCLAQAQDKAKPEFDIYSLNSIESATLTTTFFNAFYGGSFIDSTTKWDAVNQLGNKNKLGFFSLNRSEFRFAATKKFSPYVSASHQSMIGMEFPQKLFQLVFTGNNSLVGEEVQMKPSRLERWHFSTAIGGVGFQPNESIRIFAGAGPAVVYSYGKVDFGKSSFFTSVSADSVSLQLSGQYERSNSYPIVNGIGFAAELGIAGQTGQFNWKILASNLGYVWFNSKSVNSQRDSLLYFTGLNIDDLSHFSAAVDDELNQFESDLQLEGDTAKLHSSLPFMLYGQCMTQYHNLGLSLSVLQIGLPGFIPRIGFDISWPEQSKVKVVVPMKYGGYGGFNIGLGIESRIAKNITFTLCVPSLMSFSNELSPVSYILESKLTYKISRNESIF
ncbi:MAG: hypothetical protein CVU11_09210 [Bacteroidetes bacterium HGW-Bacteroidetes-6]|jgi:opacity protein-like surface antigen|nr:MAG: hypothetical protein CVU11_09210 [Bacteroidetes bacterium HGW-Bacteroidetes-6]